MYDLPAPHPLYCLPPQARGTRKRRQGAADPAAALQQQQLRHRLPQPFAPEPASASSGGGLLPVPSHLPLMELLLAPQGEGSLLSALVAPLVNRWVVGAQNEIVNDCAVNIKWILLGIAGWVMIE